MYPIVLPLTSGSSEHLELFPSYVAFTNSVNVGIYQLNGDKSCEQLAKEIFLKNKSLYYSCDLLSSNAK